MCPEALRERVPPRAGMSAMVIWPLMAPYLSMWPLIAMLAAQPGCADETPVSDGGASDGASDGNADGRVSMAPPDIPWLGEGVPPIMLAPCPPGWREVVADGVTECDPYPLEGPATCEAGEAHFPGEPGCRPIGGSCPTGDYASELPTDGSVLYVNAASAVGGDGSLAAPYRGPSEIDWIALSPGTTVAIAKGTYEGTLRVKGGVRIVGACVRDTRLTGDTGPAPAVITVLGGVGDAVVQGLTIGATAQRGLLVEGGGPVTLDGVLIERTTSAGIRAAGDDTSVTLRDVVIRDTQPLAGDGTFGRGITLQEGVDLTANRLVIRGNHDTGVFAHGVGTTVALTDAVVRDTQPTASTRTSGRGIGVQSGARLTANRVLVSGNREVGVYTSGAGTDVILTHVVVRDTQPLSSDATAGRGISVRSGARLAATGLLVAGNHDIGVHISRAGAAVTLTDSVIRDTQPRESDGAFGRGINVQFEAELSAMRVLVLRNHEHGAFLSDGAVATMTDVAVRNTQPQPGTGDFGRGLSAQLGARLDGDRLAVDASFGAGVFSHTGSLIDLRDVSIAEVFPTACTTPPCPERAYGHGAVALNSALRLTGFHIRDAVTCGVILISTSASDAPVAVDLERGIVAAAEIGVCLQVDGYDIGRLQNDVEYRDNGTNLDSTMLPVPPSGDGISG
ncbi:MAG: hypothetical protein DRJ42_12575 [Deltaproteobacteria bacterium]|nr:MAG: hypothetical protein DRJ42_12575 [Deltaproteobacteria bacterium]